VRVVFICHLEFKNISIKPSKINIFFMIFLHVFRWKCEFLWKYWEYKESFIYYVAFRGKKIS
jgi:hypothetical protein